MTLQASGAISLGNVNTELGYTSTGTLDLNNAAVRALAVKSSGVISLNDLYGKSLVTGGSFGINAVSYATGIFGNGINGYGNTTTGSYSGVFGSASGSPYINGAYVNGVFTWSLDGVITFYVHLLGDGRAKAFFNSITVSGYGTFNTNSGCTIQNNTNRTEYWWRVSSKMTNGAKTVSWT